jgi:hypothetical protein
VEQRAELGQRDQPFGFLLLGGREGRASVLGVEQHLQPGLHARGPLAARRRERLN